MAGMEAEVATIVEIVAVDLTVVIEGDLTVEIVAVEMAAAVVTEVIEAVAVVDVDVVDQVVQKVQPTLSPIQITSTNMKQDASTIRVTQLLPTMQAACLRPTPQSTIPRTLLRKAWPLVTCQLFPVQTTCQFVLAMELAASL